VAEEPAERTLSWPACWSLLACATTLATTLVPMLVGVPRVAHVVGALVLASAGAAGVVRRVYVHRALAHLVAERDRMVRLVQAGAGAYFLWSAGFVLTPHRWSAWVLALAGLGGATYGLIAWCRRVAHRPVTEHVGWRPGPPPPPDPVRTNAQAALDRAKYGWLEVTGWTPVTAGDRTVGFRAAARVRDGDTVPTVKHLDAELIAIALRQVTGAELRADWVQPRRGTFAGEWEITAVAEDVMGRVRPYVDDPTPKSSRVPALIGSDLEGKPYVQDLRAHCQDCGQTRSGKTSLINIKWAHITTWTDGVLWVCGVAKLYDTLAGWLEPYRDTGQPIPISWVASGRLDSLTMLVRAMDVARWRQNQPMHSRAEFKTIIVQLDEASDLLQDTKNRVLCQGEMLTASDIVAKFVKRNGSADVWLHLASQRSTGDQWGLRGPEISANTQWRTAFRSSDQAELGRILGWSHFNLATPPHPGCYWLKPPDEDPLMLRTPYMQEVDPNRPRLHDGPTVSDVAWARRDIPHELDPGSAAAAGAEYAQRRTLMDAGMFAYLTDAPEMAPELETVGGPSVAEQVRREADEILARAMGSAPVSLVEHRTRGAQITSLVREAGGPVTTAQIIEGLRTGGDEVANPNAVHNELARQVDAGILTRPQKGIYTATDSQHTTPHHTTHPVAVTSAGELASLPGDHV